jgi:hypothetical protein
VRYALVDSVSEHIVGLEAAMQLACHLLHEHAGVAELDVAQDGLELVLLDQLLGRLLRVRAIGLGSGSVVRLSGQAQAQAQAKAKAEAEA